jgi:hypothetical protein
MKNTQSTAAPAVAIIAGIFGLKLVPIGTGFQVFTAKQHEDNSFVREGMPHASADTKEAGVELLIAKAKELYGDDAKGVKEKGEEGLITFAGPQKAVKAFHANYSAKKKCGDLVELPGATPKVKKARNAAAATSKPRRKLSK